MRWGGWQNDYSAQCLNGAQVGSLTIDAESASVRRFMTDEIGGDRGGCFWLVIEWPRPWPAAGQFLSLPIGNRSVEVHGTSDGQVCVIVLNEHCVAEHIFVSEVIVPVGRGFKRIITGWTDGGVWVQLGARQLMAAHLVESPFFLELAPRSDDQTKSYDDAAAEAACADEVARRRHRYRPSAREDDVKKTLAAEVESLRRSVRALREDAARARNGEQHRESAVRAALRELVVNLGASYAPLLFRVAARLDAPLPMYGATKSKPPKVAEAVVFVAVGLFGTTKAMDGMELVDLEQWISRESFLGALVRARASSLAGVAADAANFLGGAHTAPSVPPMLDLLNRAQVGPAQSFLLRLLLDLADVVVDLGEFVLRGAAMRNGQ